MRQDEAGGGAQSSAHFPGNDVSDRRLAEAGRTVKYRVVEGFAALLRRFDANSERLLHALLADVFIERVRAQGLLDGSFVIGQLGVHDSIAHALSVSRPRLTVSPGPECISGAAAERPD